MLRRGAPARRNLQRGHRGARGQPPGATAAAQAGSSPGQPPKRRADYRSVRGQLPGAAALDQARAPAPGKGAACRNAHR
eukprot:7508822-Alexandrium_andersonii.AAC.1